MPDQTEQEQPGELYKKVERPLGKILLNNFLGGIFWSLGMLIGTTLVFSIIIFFVREIDFIPIIRHPKGWIIYQTLVNFIRKRSKAEGYLEISTPVMVKSLLYKNSGHWQHFGENIFNLKVDGEDYSLKPMNCPESTIIYGSKIRSYNDLPIKLSEFGILHRKELSGVLGGALRVRQFVIDDAHLFVRPDQIQQEIHKLLILTIEVYKSLNFKPRFYLATKPDKAMGDINDWNEA